MRVLAVGKGCQLIFKLIHGKDGLPLQCDGRPRGAGRMMRNRRRCTPATCE